MKRYTFETDFYGTHVLRLDENSHAVRLKDTHTQYCLASEVDSELAALRTDHNDLIIEIRGEHAEALASKDRDLADANHALLLANSNADAFKRVAEQSRNQLQRYRHILEIMVAAGTCSYEDIEDAEKIFDGLSQQLQPTTGASNG